MCYVYVRENVCVNGASRVQICLPSPTRVCTLQVTLDPILLSVKSSSVNVFPFGKNTIADDVAIILIYINQMKWMYVKRNKNLNAFSLALLFSFWCFFTNFWNFNFLINFVLHQTLFALGFSSIILHIAHLS